MTTTLNFVEQTVPNNYCGGYALVAVINSIENSKGKELLNVPPGIDIYKKIQACQADVKVGVSRAFLDASTEKGTKTPMSLPSAIALCAKKYNLTPTVYLTPEAKTLFEKAFIDEEKERLKDKVDVQDLPSSSKLPAIFSSSGCAHFVVLVNDGTHWVAVVRGTDDCFNTYNPGDGGNVKDIPGGTELPLLTYSGIVIAFKQ